MSKHFVRDDDGTLTGVVLVDVNDNWKRYPGASEFGSRSCSASMGFLQPEHYINDGLGLDIDERGNFKASKADYKTSVARVYAASDCRRGQDLVVRAINEGREAAREIDRDLMGETELP